MALRVVLLGSYGRKAGALMRSVYAPVLGLGGWLLGALIVLTATRGVPLDDERLAVLCVGVPVARGVYLACVQRGTSVRSKLVGLAAAAAGALAGAYLGFHAATDLLALLTAIAGAVAGANLTLVLLDMSRAAAVRARLADTAAPRATLDPAATSGAGR